MSDVIAYGGAVAGSPTASVAARIAHAFARWPNLHQVVVYRTPFNRIYVRPCWPSANLDELGEVIGVYGRDVTVQQIVEDMQEVTA